MCIPRTVVHHYCNSAEEQQLTILIDANGCSLCIGQVDLHRRKSHVAVVTQAREVERGRLCFDHLHETGGESFEGKRSNFGACLKLRQRIVH